MSNIEVKEKEKIDEQDERTSDKMQGKIPDIFKFIWAPGHKHT